MESAASEANGERLREFGREMQTMGTLRCFVHFSTYLRGKEELVVTVRAPSGGAASARRLLLAARHSPRKRENKKHPAENPGKIALVPASPAARESDAIRRGGAAVFLLSCYAAYGRPLVWLRSEAAGVDAAENDRPLFLDSTDDWQQSADDESEGEGEDDDGVACWEVVRELVTETLGPSAAPNPFAVDHAALGRMPPPERCVAAGALANFLWEVYSSSGSRSAAFAPALLADLRRLAQSHFADLPSLLSAAAAAAERK